MLWKNSLILSVGLALALSIETSVLGNDLLVANNVSAPPTAPDGVLRYNGTTGAFIGSFLNGPIVDPVALTYGPDGNLYVGTATAAIFKYEGLSGTFMNTFVPAGSAQLHSILDMTFGPDGNLYVADRSSRAIRRFNGSSGAYIDAWGTSGAGLLSFPQGLTFNSDGRLYVGDGNRVRRYDSVGNFVDDFVPSF